ncbi:hypothetical protein IAU60_006801 [Kwoniella sp. DSM 27419]
MNLDHPRSSSDTPPRFSGESLTPHNEYSGLFTSGLLPECKPSPSPSRTAFPSPSRPPYSASHSTPGKSHATGLGDMFRTPRRRRSSILHSTPKSASPRVIKSSGADHGVERALDSVMRNLRIAVTPRKQSYLGPQSRWSSSTEGSDPAHDQDDSIATETSDTSNKTRKSSDTSRSKLTLRSVKSFKSNRSKAVPRKSEDNERMDVDSVSSEYDMIPDVPPVPPEARSHTPTPHTPGRSRRMMNGLAKRLGLTPKKASIAPGGSVPGFSIPSYPPPPPPLPLPPTNRQMPRKSSFSTLRSALTKESSTTTLKSVRSVAGGAGSSAQHPFFSSTSQTIDCGTPPLPPLVTAKVGRPSEEGHSACFPHTPRSSGRRTPKSSIGPHQYLPETSPSHFLAAMPRPAPATPKRTTLDPEGAQAKQTPRRAGIGRTISGGLNLDDIADVIMTTGATAEFDGGANSGKSNSHRDDHSASRQDIARPPAVPPKAEAPAVPSKSSLAAPTLRKAKARREFNPLMGNGSLPADIAALPHGVAAYGRAAAKPKSTATGRDPLSDKTLNAIIQPGPNNDRVISKGSKGPIGIMKKLRLSSKASDVAGGDMGARNNRFELQPAMAFPTPKPFHTNREPLPRKALDLGTAESYFDSALNTFGAARTMNWTPRRRIPDFSASPPASADSSLLSIARGTEELQEKDRFADEDMGDDAHAYESAEYHFQLDPSELTSVGEGPKVDIDWRDKLQRSKPSLGSESEIYSVTTGEGAEAWELEKYLEGVERDEARPTTGQSGWI